MRQIKAWVGGGTERERDKDRETENQREQADGGRETGETIKYEPMSLY